MVLSVIDDGLFPGLWQASLLYDSSSERRFHNPPKVENGVFEVHDIARLGLSVSGRLSLESLSGLILRPANVVYW